MENVILGITPKGEEHNGHTVRYADDFVATASNRKEASKIRIVSSQFLGNKGLLLNESKTKVINIRDGFEYLSWEIRLRKRNEPGINQPVNGEIRWVLVIRPSNKSIKAVRQRIRLCFEGWEIKGFNTYCLISDMNALVRG